MFDDAPRRGAPSSADVAEGRAAGGSPDRHTSVMTSGEENVSALLPDEVGS